VKRILVVPDTQARPGVPLDHLDWAAKAIVEYRPDIVVHMGDHWDMPSMSAWESPGSLATEGARYEDDIDTGNEAFERLCLPMEKEQKRLAKGRRKRWNIEKHFLFGNHEDRIDRALRKEPKYTGMIGRHHCLTRDWQRHEFLEVVPLQGILFSHYFANVNSGRPIGGSIDTRLNKIGESFVQGHEQGFLYGCRQFPSGKTRHGLVGGSYYLHDEDYKGRQGNGHWRGLVVLHEAHDGDYDIMKLSMPYLRQKYA
jgi:hypothetical protein